MWFFSVLSFFFFLNTVFCREVLSLNIISLFLLLPFVNSAIRTFASSYWQNSWRDRAGLGWFGSSWNLHWYWRPPRVNARSDWRGVGGIYVLFWTVHSSLVEWSRRIQPGCNTASRYTTQYVESFVGFGCGRGRAWRGRRGRLINRQQKSKCAAVFRIIDSAISLRNAWREPVVKQSAATSQCPHNITYDWHVFVGTCISVIFHCPPPTTPL